MERKFDLEKALEEIKAGASLDGKNSVLTFTIGGVVIEYLLFNGWLKVQPYK